MGEVSMTETAGEALTAAAVETIARSGGPVAGRASGHRPTLPRAPHEFADSLPPLKRRQNSAASGFCGKTPKIAPRSRELVQDLAERIEQRQAELDALAEAEHQDAVVSQEDELRTRETAQLAARQVKVRELRQELGALEDRFSNAWRTQENVNPLREPMRQLRAQITQLNDEIRIIENRLADPLSAPANRPSLIPCPSIPPQPSGFERVTTCLRPPCARWPRWSARRGPEKPGTATRSSDTTRRLGGRSRFRSTKTSFLLLSSAPERRFCSLGGFSAWRYVEIDARCGVRAAPNSQSQPGISPAVQTTTDASRSRPESPQLVARFELLGVPKSWQNERLHQMARQAAMRKWRDVTWLAKVM